MFMSEAFFDKLENDWPAPVMDDDDEEEYWPDGMTLGEWQRSRPAKFASEDEYR